MPQTSSRGPLLQLHCLNIWLTEQCKPHVENNKWQVEQNYLEKEASHFTSSQAKEEPMPKISSLLISPKLSFVSRIRCKLGSQIEFFITIGVQTTTRFLYPSSNRNNHRPNKKKGSSIKPSFSLEHMIPPKGCTLISQLW